MSLAFVLVLLTAVVGSSMMVAVFAWMFHRIRRIESGGTSHLGSGAVEEQLARLREELVTMQGEVSNLAERVDFTERLLMGGDEKEGPGTLEA